MFRNCILQHIFSVGILAGRNVYSVRMLKGDFVCRCDGKRSVQCQYVARRSVRNVCSDSMLLGGVSGVSAVSAC
jgi:hypothetical protein